MENRDILLKKIEAQEKKWEAEVKHLQSRSANLDADTRLKFKEKLAELNRKLEDVRIQSSRVRRTSNDEWSRLGDNITHIWNDLVTNIDNAILRLKR